MNYLLKIKKYLKENKSYLSIMFSGFILLFIQMNSVVFYADDFSFGVVKKSIGFLGIFNRFIEYYNSWGRWFSCININVYSNV